MPGQSAPKHLLQHLFQGLDRPPELPPSANLSYKGLKKEVGACGPAAKTLLANP